MVFRTRRRLCAAGILAGPAALAGTAAFAQGNAVGAIVVGQTYVGSGPLSGLSTDPNLGVDALISSVNANGGIRGRKLELRRTDDAYSASRAGDNVRAAVAQGAVAILLPIGTTPAEAALAAASDLKVPVVGAYSGSDTLAQFREVGFPVRISFSEEYARIVRHLLTIGMTRIAFLHNDNPGARGAMEATRKALEAQGRSLIGSAAIRQDGADAATQAGVVAGMQPEAVVMAVTNQVAQRFLPAYSAAGVRSQFYAFSFVNGRALHAAIGKASAGLVISQVVPNPWNATRPVVIEYQQAMMKLGHDLSYGSLEGYISAKILVEGLRRAAPAPSAASLARALESLGDHDIGGLRVRYSAEGHHGLGFSELSMLKADGSYAR